MLAAGLYVHVAANQLLRGAKRAHLTELTEEKQSNMPAVSPAMVAIAAAVLVILSRRSGQAITHHKKKSPKLPQNQKVTGNGLRQNRKSAGVTSEAGKSPAGRAYANGTVRRQRSHERISSPASSVNSRSRCRRICVSSQHQPNEVPWNEADARTTPANATAPASGAAAAVGSNAACCSLNHARSRG